MVEQELCSLPTPSPPKMQHNAVVNSNILDRDNKQKHFKVKLVAKN